MLQTLEVRRYATRRNLSMLSHRRSTQSDVFSRLQGRYFTLDAKQASAGTLDQPSHRTHAAVPRALSALLIHLRAATAAMSALRELADIRSFADGALAAMRCSFSVCLRAR